MTEKVCPNCGRANQFEDPSCRACGTTLYVREPLAKRQSSVTASKAIGVTTLVLIGLPCGVLGAITILFGAITAHVWPIAFGLLALVPCWLIVRECTRAWERR